MARRTRRGRAQASGDEEILGGSIDHLIHAAMSSPDGTTGRFIVTVQRDGMDAATASLSSVCGLATVSSDDYNHGIVPNDDMTDKAIALPNINAMILPRLPNQSPMAGLTSADSGIRSIYAERIAFLPIDGSGMIFNPQPFNAGQGSTRPDAVAFPAPFANPLVPPLTGASLGGRSLDFWQGYWSALTQVLFGSSSLALPPGFPPFAMPTMPTPVRGGTALGDPHFGVGAAGGLAGALAETWGLRATRVPTSHFSGEGVRVALLDTGIDLTHPDFQDGRIVARASFVGEPVQDIPAPANPLLGIPGNPGHGTHVAGTACGPRVPPGGSVEGRYGVAFAAQILVGKVFKNNGTTVEGAIFNGMNWAIGKGAHIISMSLSGPPNAQNDARYAAIADAAFQNGTAIVAAVGNNSRRNASPPIIFPVQSPANSLRIMGVGAIDENELVAVFSNRGVFGSAEGVDVSAPGVNVYSSLPPGSPAGGGTLYGRLSGTSMATPHVAGIAALVKQQNMDFNPAQLLQQVVRLTRRLNGDQNDIGRGIVQAPQ